MTYPDTLRFLYSLGHELKVVKWDLDRISRLLAKLGNPHRACRFVHVAGTNGKGSVCAMIESGLRASGRRTGLYTSPHLIDPRERIAIAGEPVSEELWTEAFTEVHAAAESLLATESIDTHPTFFETVTAMAFLIFARAKVEWVVLETGLGGRLDATNVVDPELSVITPIDFDHEAFLGSSIESIAREKAGILKSGRPAVVAPQRAEAWQVIRARAVELFVPLLRCPPITAAVEKYSSRFIFKGTEIICPLAGAHQAQNAATAALALDVLETPLPAIVSGIANAKWPGRLEVVRHNPDLILDGAHNPAGARALANYIKTFFTDQPIRLIFGAMRDKAIDEVTGILFPLATEIVLTRPDQPRALSPESLLETAPNALVTQDLESALNLPAMTTFVTGSLYLVGEARRLMAIKPKPLKASQIGPGSGDAPPPVEL